jgi:hypothetical protein
MSVRTDCHRPGTIVPSDYDYIMSYCMPGSEPWDQFNMDAARKLCEGINWGRGDGPSMFGVLGKCGICGAVYRTGDIWMHEPTGDFVHVGHNCADKYAMLAARPGFDAALEELKQRRATFIREQKKLALQERFLDAHPGLKEALALDHKILRDMAANFARWNSLTPKQVAFAMKLAADVKARIANPPPAEKHVPAPTGRVTVKGTVVSRKLYGDDADYHRGGIAFGPVYKITVKVVTPDGVWLAWGSAVANCKVGDVVEFTATLTAGRDPHFAFFKRPLKSRVVTPSAQATVDA